MREDPMKTINTLSMLILTAVLAPVPATADSHDTFTQELSVPDAFTLEVSTGSGSIDIRTGPGRDVSIVGKVKAKRKGLFRRGANADEIIRQVVENPPVELQGNTLRVGKIKDRSIRDEVSISYTIVVPADTEVNARAGSGSIDVADIAANVEVRSGSGRLELANIGGPVTAKAGSGTIRAEGVAGAFTASTGSGGIFMSQTAPGDVKVSTGSGGMELTGVVGALKASAGSGRIRIDGRQEGDWKIGAGSGSVRIDLPDDAAFTLDAETGSGGIDIEYPLTIEGKISRRHLRGDVAGGGHLLKVDTGSGGVRIE